jgi:tetratricopeptide (TPR) repeat protein
MTGVLWSSAFVAAVFAIHPLRVESVAWVAERKDVLSGLFFMLTLGAYVRYVQKRSRADYCLVLLFFALGLMCKPMLVTLPFVLLLLDYWPLHRFGAAANRFSISRKLIVEKIPLIILSIALCLVTLAVQQQDKEISFSLRISNALVSYITYCGQMFYPVGLAVLYPYPTHGLPIEKTILALLLLVAVSAGAFCWRQKHPYFLMGWLWYLGMLVPVIGLVQVGAQARADRYTYLPQIGLYILLTWMVVKLTASWRSRRWVLGGGAMVILAALITCAHAQTAYWRNSESLWTHTLACTSGNSVAHNSLGDVFLQQGRMNEATAQFQKALAIKPDDAEAHYNLGDVFLQQGRMNEATAQFQKALAIKPDDAEAHNNLGDIFLQQGRLDEAIAQFQKALAIKPDDAEPYYNLGNAFLQQGRMDEAIAHYQKALEINPDDADIHNNLGNIFFQQGRMAEAISHYQKALAINPNYARAHYNLGSAFRQQGRLEEAIAQYQRALAIKPDYVEAQNTMAWVLATCPQTSLRDGSKAVGLAERANQLVGGKDPVILSTLAAAYAETGRFPEAVETAQRAMQLAEMQSDTTLAGALQSQLKLYQAGIPFRDTE